MSYTVKSSEKTKKTGADYETKALLYLMNFRSDSDEIHYFVVDFFNDLTGMDRMASPPDSPEEDADNPRLTASSSFFFFFCTGTEKTLPVFFFFLCSLP